MRSRARQPSGAARALRVCGLGLALLALAACSGGGGSHLPRPTPFDPALAAKLHDIRAKASEVRGLPPYEKVKEGTITQEALVNYAKAQAGKMTDDEKRELDSYTAALRLLRLIGPQDDLLKIFSEDYPANILGIYLPDARELVMIGGGQQIGMSDELTLAHEYTHSFQDGSFGIEKLRKRWEKSTTERDGHSQYGETIDCLVEGDAVVSERLYAERAFGSDWQQKLQQEPAEAEAQAATPLPEFLDRAFLFNYQECGAFVQALYNKGGWGAVNAAYEKPPATTEQVLHLDKYESREVSNGQQPVDLSKSVGKGWALLDTSQFGEFDVYNYALTMAKDDAAARIAAAGWGGGWLSIYRNKEQSEQVLVQLSLSWDTNDDMNEFLAVFGAILDARAVQWQIQQGQPEVNWTADGEHGFLRWNDTKARVDILIATDADTLGRVR